MRVAGVIAVVLFVFAVPAGSVASTQASAVLELRVGSYDGAVTLDPTGRLLDPSCPQNTCTFAYVVGTRVKLAAVNGSYSAFVEWGGGCTGPSPICEVTVHRDRKVRASFSRLTLFYGSVTKGGYVKPDVAGTSCGSGCVVYPFGTPDVGVDAIVNDSAFEFDRWGAECAGVESAGCYFPGPMRVNRFASAYFKRRDGLGTTSGPLVSSSRAWVRITGSGTVSTTLGEREITCAVRECRIDPLKGATVVLTATPADGWQLSRWTGRCSGSQTQCAFSNQAPRYYPWVRATFVPR